MNKHHLTEICNKFGFVKNCGGEINATFNFY